jgi:hypothetical protein
MHHHRHQHAADGIPLHDAAHAHAPVPRSADGLFVFGGNISRIIYFRLKLRYTRPRQATSHPDTDADDKMFDSIG